MAVSFSLFKKRNSSANPFVKILQCRIFEIRASANDGHAYGEGAPNCYLNSDQNSEFCAKSL
mgnify:CR=1 FL=1